MLLTDPGCNSKVVTGVRKGANSRMTLKRNLVLSLVFGIAGGLAAYLLAWGLFATHQELGMDSRSALAIAAWTAPVIFLASVVYFAARTAGRR